MRDHIPLKVTQFKGLWYRSGRDSETPRDHFSGCRNMSFTHRGVKTRDGSALSLTLANIRRQAIFRIQGQAQRLLILNDSNQLFDSTNLGTPILTVSGMVDFSMVTMFNRAYITPHNGVTGLPGEKVYVYSGGGPGTCRAAAGPAPSGFTLVAADSVSSGKVEEGTHLIGVSYITNTGYITIPGGFVQIDTIGGRKVDVSIIPLGPSYVVARLLVGTKIIVDFNGDLINQTYYRIPDGQINDNTTTTLTLDYYDTELIEDITYLLEQLPEIPAGTCITNYNGRLVSAGEDANQSTAWVSRPGEPESINGVEGFFTANPGDAGSGIKNIYVHRESLVICKSQRSYMTVDNEEEAVFWRVTALDMSIGTEPHGIGKVLDYGELIEDFSVVASRSGLRLFNGSFLPNELSWKIENRWNDINRAFFHTVEVAIDPENSMIYVAAPFSDSEYPNRMLVADYSAGLDADSIKWSEWTFPVFPQTIVVDIDATTKRPILKIGGRAGNVYYVSYDFTNDFDNAIVGNVEFAPLPGETDDTEEGIYHFGGIHANIRGVGAVTITVTDQQDSKTLIAVPWTLSLAPPTEMKRLFNFTANRCIVSFTMLDANSRLEMTRFVLWAKWLWSEFPT